MVYAIQGRNIPDMNDLAHVAGRKPYDQHDLPQFPGLDLCQADPAQPLTTAGKQVDHLRMIYL